MFSGTISVVRSRPSPAILMSTDPFVEVGSVRSGRAAGLGLSYCGNSCGGFLDSKRPHFRLNMLGSSLLGGGRILSRDDTEPGTLGQSEQLTVEMARLPTLFSQVARKTGLYSPRGGKSCFGVCPSKRVVCVTNLLQEVPHFVQVFAAGRVWLSAVFARTPLGQDFPHPSPSSLPKTPRLVCCRLPSRAPLLSRLLLRRLLKEGRLGFWEEVRDLYLEGGCQLLECLDLRANLAALNVDDCHLVNLCQLCEALLTQPALFTYPPQFIHRTPGARDH